MDWSTTLNINYPVPIQKTIQFSRDPRYKKFKCNKDLTYKIMLFNNIAQNQLNIIRQILSSKLTIGEICPYVQKRFEMVIIPNKDVIIKSIKENYPDISQKNKQKYLSYIASLPHPNKKSSLLDITPFSFDFYVAYFHSKGVIDDKTADIIMNGYNNNKVLLDEIEKCIQNPKTRYIIISIGINQFNMSASVHANFAIIDTKRKHIYHIEPEIREKHHAYLENAKESLKYIFDKWFPKYKFKSIVDEFRFCPMVFQGQTNDMLCQSWVIFLSIIYILNPTISPQVLLNYLHNKRYPIEVNGNNQKMLEALMEFLYMEYLMIKNTSPGIIQNISIKPRKQYVSPILTKECLQIKGGNRTNISPFGIQMVIQQQLNKLRANPNFKGYITIGKQSLLPVIVIKYIG